MRKLEQGGKRREAEKASKNGVKHIHMGDGKNKQTRVKETKRIM